jgi:hypothetical protein
MPEDDNPTSSSRAPAYYVYHVRDKEGGNAIKTQRRQCLATAKSRRFRSRRYLAGA